MPTRTIQYPDSQVNRIAITPDRAFLAAAGHPHIRFFDINSNNPSAVRQPPSGADHQSQTSLILPTLPMAKGLEFRWAHNECDKLGIP